MKTITLLLLIINCAIGSLYAQYEIRTSTDGYTVISKVPGRMYSVDVPGKTIKPIGENKYDHPYMIIDGRLLQVMSVPLEEFNGSSKDTAEDTLKKQMLYETGFLKIPENEIKSEIHKLSSAGTALLWSFVPPVVSGQQPPKATYVSIMGVGYVVVLASQEVKPEQRDLPMEEWLMLIANSLDAKP